MRQQEDNERRASALGARQSARKPYRKPAVRSERVFEVQALTCGKIQTTESGCHHNRKTS